MGSVERISGWRLTGLREPKVRDLGRRSGHFEETTRPVLQPSFLAVLQPKSPPGNLVQAEHALGRRLRDLGETKCSGLVRENAPASLKKYSKSSRALSAYKEHFQRTDRALSEYGLSTLSVQTEHFQCTDRAL